MKLSMMTAACVGALAALGASPQARAIDFDFHHGSECKVFGSTAWTDLAFSGYGVKNLQSSARQVICPVTKNAESAWDGTATAGANIRVYVEAGAVAAAVTCTGYVTSENAAVTGVNTYSKAFGQIPANTASDDFLLPFSQFSTLPGSNYWEDKVYMLCTLGPQTRLKGYYIYEYAATD